MPCNPFPCCQQAVKSRPPINQSIVAVASIVITVLVIVLVSGRHVLVLPKVQLVQEDASKARRSRRRRR